MTVDELKVIITAQTSGLRTEIGKAKTQVQGLETAAKKSAGGISNAFKAIGRTLIVLGIGKALKDGFAAAVSVEAGIQQLSRTLGSNSKEFMNWVNIQAAGFGLSKTEAVKYGMTFSNMISGFTKDTKQNTAITTQLLQMSAVIASKTGRTTEDVMSRVRSGMLGSTEAIEDLGVYTKVSSIEQTKAFKQMADGKSWMQLDFNVQQAITALAILEQASEKYGNTMSDTVATKLLMFNAELQNLSLALGDAVKPIASVVLPYLTQFVQWLTIGLQAVAAFSQALFGIKINTELESASTNTASMSDSLDTAAGNAKKLKTSLMGFDEINSLSSGDSATASGGSTSTGGGIKMPEVDMPSVAAAAEKIKSFLNFDFLTVAWQNLQTAIQPLVDTIGNALVWFYNSVLLPLGSWVLTEAVPAFMNLIAGALTLLNGVLVVLQPLALWLWTEFLQPIAVWTGGVMVVVINAIADAMIRISGWISENQTLVEVIAILVGSFAAAWGLVNLAIGIWNVIGVIATAVTGAFGVAVAFLTSPIGLVILAIAAVIAIVVLLVKYWDKIAPALDAALAWVVQAFEDVVNWIWRNVIVPVGKFFKDLWQSIVNIFNGVGQFFSFVFTEAWNGIVNAFASIGKFFQELWNNIVSTFTTIGTLIGDAVSGAFKTVVNGIINFAEKAINGFIRAINFAIGLINGVLGWTGINIGTVHELAIPRLAQGGIVDGGRLVYAGEAGKEAIMPLENNTGWIRELASQLNNNGSGGEVVINLDGREIARVVTNHQTRQNLQYGTA